MAKIIYDKLVRDKIPEIIEKSGKTCETEILTDEEYIKMLDKKLSEELAEYHAAQNLEELADLLEVLYAAALSRGYTLEELEQVGLVYGCTSDAKSDTEHYLPGVDINQLSIGRLLSTIESYGCEDFKIDHTKEFGSQWEAFTMDKQESYAKSNAILLKDL